MISTPDSKRIERVLTFWFGDPESVGETRDWWFSSTPELDRQIAARFGDDIRLATNRGYDDWTVSPQGTLAVVIILDQFTRNAFRGTPAAFQADHLALSYTKSAIAKKFDRQLPDIQRKFLYMPFMHSEDLATQTQSVALFQQFDEQTYKFAVRHKEIIERFDRFPHRNETLGRESTAEEIEFLKEPNSSF